MSGILEAQLLFLVAGLGILAALRAWPTWADLLRTLGIAYVLGVAAVGVVSTIALVASSGLGVAYAVALSLALFGAGTAIGWRRGHRLPRVSGFSRPQLTPTALVTAAFVLLVVVVLADFWRVARYQGVVAWDGWAFWVPKAKGIYYFGGLDLGVLREVFNPSYPMLVPSIQAIDFHLIGSADATLLALQYWFLLVGFVAAAWALLRTVVSPLVLWPFLALATVLPEIDKRMLNAQGDWPLDIFFALAALCLVRWLREREGWLLWSFGILLAAALATKREGQLFAACLVLSVLAATWQSRRATWGWIAGASAVAFALNVPWRIWFTAHELQSDAPPSWLPRHADRIGPSFRIAAQLLFGYDLWLIAVPLALAAAVLLAERRDFGLPTVYLGTVVLGFLGCVWILSVFPDFPLDTSQQTPIPRAVGALVLLSIVYAPLMLSRVLAADQGTAPIFLSSLFTSAAETRTVDALRSARSE